MIVTSMIGPESSTEDDNFFLHNLPAAVSPVILGL